MNKLAFTAPHALASEIGLSLLKEGCHAIDAMVGAAAAISVAYPHMNSIGGDGFWLIHEPGRAPVAIDASGVSSHSIRARDYTERGFSAIPPRGADACITMGGTISGWQLARDVATSMFQKKNSPLSTVLSPATALARSGIPVSESLVTATRKCAADIRGGEYQDPALFAPFQDIFMRGGEPFEAGATLINADLANTFDQLIYAGLDDFYRGDLANTLAGHLNSVGSNISIDDFNHYHAKIVRPLCAELRGCQVYNLPLPTQGLASLLILGIYDKCYQETFSEAERVHYLIEATKEAFLIRDRVVGDPSRAEANVDEFLKKVCLEELASKLSPEAKPWPYSASPGDTVWMGCVDGNGTMVSFIQSVYWEFGSCVVIPNTGVVWNNRGSSFSLDEKHHNGLGPGLKPFHTLNPAFGDFGDGRRVVYGTMGGEGQPQTQAALFTRKFFDGMTLNEAISTDRWLLGRTWGDANSDLKLEEGLYSKIGKELEAFGHSVTVVPSGNEMMGHAGAIIVDENGIQECATDPRSDGAALVA